VCSKTFSRAGVRPVDGTPTRIYQVTRCFRPYGCGPDVMKWYGNSLSQAFSSAGVVRGGDGTRGRPSTSCGGESHGESRSPCVTARARIHPDCFSPRVSRWPRRSARFPCRTRHFRQELLSRPMVASGSRSCMPIDFSASIQTRIASPKSRLSNETLPRVSSSILWTGMVRASARGFVVESRRDCQADGICAAVGSGG